MTELEFCSRLNALAGDMPAETHRVFVTAVSGRAETRALKKRHPVALVVAILISLVTLAVAATEIIPTFLVDWHGEVSENPDFPPEELTVSEMDIIKRTHALLSAVPEDVFGILEWDGSPQRFSRGRTRKATSLEGVPHPGVFLPDDVEQKDGFVVDLTLGCAANGEYRLVKEEIVDDFIVKQYAVDPSDDILTGYTIGYMDENRLWRSIRCQLAVTQNNRFSFFADEAHTAKPVDIPGMDNAVFVTLGINRTLIAARTLESPVRVKAPPSQVALGDRNGIIEYTCELFELDGFTLEECMAVFGVIPFADATSQ